MKLYGLKNCDSCRKAMRFLDAAGVAYEFLDIRNTPIKVEKLRQWLKLTGRDTLINKRSTTYRALSDQERELLETSPAKTLATHPTLIKRPLIEGPDGVSVGWSAEIEKKFR